MADISAPTSRPADVSEHKDGKANAPDLRAGLTPDDHRKAFAQQKDKAADVPALAIVGADKAEAPKTKDAAEKLADPERKRAAEFQQTLSDLAPMWVNAPEKDAKAEIDKARKAIEAEEKAGVFGPASQEAYKKFVETLQARSLGTIKEMDAMQLALPPGCPIQLPMDDHQRAINPQLFKALAAGEKLDTGMKFDTNKVPSEADIARMDNAFDWMAGCNSKIQIARGEFKDKTLTALIKENHLPEGWLKKPGDDPVAWRQSAEQMINLSVASRNYVEAMQSLLKGSKDGDFPFELPPGAKVVVEIDGKRREITDKEINDPSARYALKEGKIKEVTLDLPKDLRQEEPGNRQKIDNMVDWLTKYGDKIDKTLAAMMNVQNNPDAVVMYGDVEIKNGKGRFDQAGNFLGLVNPDKYQPKPGETLRDLNLVGYNFDVQKVGEGDNAKYKVSQTINAEKAPFWAYQNIRCLGVEKVGNSMPVETKEYGPDDFVPVRNGSKIELVKAKNLESFKRMQQIEYYGEKGLIATMDAAMLVSGTIEIGAAVKGARIAATAAEAGLKLTASQATWEIGKGLVRVGVAGAGVFNNAGARETEWGSVVNNVRNAYFVLDMTGGLARGGLGAARRAMGMGKAAEAGEALTSVEKVHSIINGTEKIVVNGEPLKGIPWIKQIHQGTHWAFKGTEAVFVPVAGMDIKHQADRIRDAHKRDPLKDAAIQVGDGRIGVLADRDAFNPKKTGVLDAARNVLDSYATSLTDGRDKATQDQVKQILDTTKKLISPDASAEERETFKRQLLGNMSFTGEQIRELEKAHPTASETESFRLSDQDLHNLMDPSKRKDFPKAVRDLAEKYLSEKNPDVLAASRVAMMYVSRDNDGKIQDELAKIKFDVPEYKRTITTYDSEGGAYSRDVTIGARQATVSLSSAEAIGDLKRDLADPKRGARGIATGDCLVRVGAITHQEYAGVLQDVLRDPAASKADRMRALTDAYGARLGSIIDGIRYQESDDKRPQAEQEALRGRTFGLSSQELIKTLSDTAKNDKDADVRAMSAALLYSLSEKDVNQRSRYMNAFNETWQKLGSQDGAFAQRITQFFQKDMALGVPADNDAAADKVRDTRVHAAMALSAMTADSDKAQQKQITECLAGSMSATRPDLTAKVMDALLPDRLKALTTENPELANKARAAAVELIHKPKSDQEAEQMVRVLNKIEPLLRDGDRSLKQELDHRLQELLTNNALNKNYASGYPELRVAAIDTLGALGSRGAVDVIRTHLGDKATVKSGNDEISMNESNPAVRAAGIRALEKMKDPMLRNLVGELISKETDANNAALLRDVKFANERIEPSSEEYKRIYEQARVDVIGPLEKHPHLKGFGEAQVVEFINSRFDLLNVNTFQDRAQNAAKNCMSGWSRFWSFESTEKLNETIAVNQVEAQRREQWDALQKLAKGRGEDADKAKLVLSYMIQHHGGICGGQSGCCVQMDGDKLHTRLYNFDWKSMAARTLAECADNGCATRDVTAYAIKQGLQNSSLPSYVSFYLLDGMKKLGQKDKDGFAIPRDQQAEIYAAALKAEFDRVPSEQNAKYQTELLSEFQKLGARRMFPVLDAIAKDSRLPEVAKQARGIMNSWEHSVHLMWNDTAEDQKATPDERADRIKKALADNNNAEQTVQQIFNAYKGYSISDANDPGLAFLQMAMNDNNERTRFAGARILLESKLPDNNALKQKAVQVFAALAATGSNEQCRAEAVCELGRAPLTAPITVPAPGGGSFIVQKTAKGVEVKKQ